MEEYLKLKRQLFEKAYSFLNEEQREAVFAVNGPLLVLAGAGSGKTTVLVNRIGFLVRYGNAYESNYVPFDANEETIKELKTLLTRTPEELRNGLLDRFASQKCPPWQVLAITFTNKAAKEMQTRLATMFPEEETATQIQGGTFHSFCLRVLRIYGDRMGYREGFTVYDTDDTKKAIAEAFKRCDIDDKMLPPKSVQTAISRAKDSMLSVDDFSAQYGTDFRMSMIARVYEAYQQILKENNALDFDDLLMQTVLLLQNNEDVLKKYQEKFRYISVDEYQDTNKVQFELCRLLAGGYRNLMVVGDDDQSIYRFRGATVENILSFDKIYKDCRVIKLERNYRSTANILNAANAVIAKNERRKRKELWTEKNAGELISVLSTADQNDEVYRILDAIQKGVKNGRQYRDFAILYRTNAQSNVIEKVFARSHPPVPYRVMGGTRFSDRKEIKDAVSYLQLIANHDDNLRLARIINEPKRGLGKITLDAVAQIALETNQSQFQVMANATRYPALKRSETTLVYFADIINNLTRLSTEIPLDAFFDVMLDKTGYRRMLEEGGEAEKERLENLAEFKSNIVEYLNSAENPSLSSFLEETALVADVDRYDETADAVVMMTIHSAKGLEFPVVFLPGMEDGLFPGMQTIEAGPAEMEEERRLAYVAITRAKEKLYILHAHNRLLYGKTNAYPLSRFVGDIPDEVVSMEEKMNSIFENNLGGKSTTKCYAFPSRKESTINEAIQVGGLRATTNQTSEALAPGDRVLHEKFGEGDILSVTSMSGDCLYEIVFDSVGTKKLMGKFAKLKKL